MINLQPKNIILESDTLNYFSFKKDSVFSIDGVSVIYPIRGVDRWNNLNTSSMYLNYQNINPVEIIVVEEDVSSRIHSNMSLLRKSFSYYFLKGGINFNKCKAINYGVSKAKYNKIIMLDVDIILPKNYIKNMAEKLNSYGFVFMLNKVYYLNRQPRFPDNRFFAMTMRDDQFSGGSIGFNKKDFYNIGGMNEKFEGYGSEDCEFFDRIRLKGNTFINRIYPCLHMPHQRKHSYSQNAKLYEDVSRLNIDTRISELKKDLNKYGSF